MVWNSQYALYAWGSLRRLQVTPHADYTAQQCGWNSHSRSSLQQPPNDSALVISFGVVSGDGGPAGGGGRSLRALLDSFRTSAGGSNDYLRTVLLGTLRSSVLMTPRYFIAGASLLLLLSRGGPQTKLPTQVSTAHPSPSICHYCCIRPYKASTTSLLMMDMLVRTSGVVSREAPDPRR